jgi:hypothetical protein
LNKTERFSKVSGYALCSDRSSDFPALLAAFPFTSHLFMNSGTQWLKRFPFPHEIRKRRDYSGGPVPDFNGVPY